ncbi:MAG TPA: secondary thiamine-phosphate synthase enzyme YjbQ [Actinomycetota bacterium]|nr:secondary thiamine-phosphate synthase enzyme YjbQ [Actinomycetota bacterium]
MRSQTTEIRVLPERRLDIVDLTDDLRRAIKDGGITDGVAIAFCRHTTAVLVVNEWEDGALQDLRARVEALVPADVYYAHDDLERRTQNLDEAHERANGRAHVAAMLLGGTSQVIPIAGGEPVLGTWQRLLLIELDQPKDRVVSLQILGE